MRGPGRQSRTGEDEVIGEDQIRSPARAVGRRHYRVEPELEKCCVDTVYTSVLVDVKRLIVGHPAEERLRRGAARLQRLCQLEELPAQVRQPGPRLCDVE